MEETKLEHEVHDDGSITVKLLEPIQLGKRKITELSFRKPKARDMRQLKNKMTTSDCLDLAGRLAGEPPSTMDELGMDDMAEIMEIVGGFLPNSRRTGKKD